MASSGSPQTYAILSILAGALLAGLYVTLPYFQAFFTLPAINDISTDLEDPPVFRDIGVPPYPQTFISLQRNGYPNLESVLVPLPPEQTFGRARDAAIDMGWRIAAATEPKDGGEGRLEAVVTTRVFRFKDDVAVRLRPAVGGTEVDVRSRSRVGRHDLGANAQRIRAFLERLQR